MKKIVTVYKSLNPGSFLQAVCLYEVVSEKYKNVCFFDSKARKPFLSSIKLAMKLLFKGKISYSLKQLKMASEYNNLLKKYHTDSRKKTGDVYILGSDEIWNVSRKSMTKFPVFWGVGLNKCISYGPSINNATIEDFNKCSYAIEALNNIQFLSVRDYYTKNILSKFTDKDIKLVCDPVMLLPVDEYRKKYIKRERKYKFIFIYGPESYFKKNEIEEIVQYAKENNLKLISYYYYHNWVDNVVFGDPYSFLELIDSSEAVFTSTFHGTTFSILYNKKFIVFGENRKVQETLNTFNKSLKNYSPGKIESLINGDYEYNKVNMIIDDISKESRKYLFEALDKL